MASQHTDSRLTASGPALAADLAESKSLRGELTELKAAHAAALQQLKDTQGYRETTHKDYKWSFLASFKRESALEDALKEAQAKLHSAQQELVQLKNKYEALRANREKWKAYVLKWNENFKTCVESYEKRLSVAENIQQATILQLNEAVIKLEDMEAKMDDMEIENSALRRKLDWTTHDLHLANDALRVATREADDVETVSMGQRTFGRQASHFPVPGDWAQVTQDKDDLDSLAQELIETPLDTPTTLSNRRDHISTPVPEIHIKGRIVVTKNTMPTAASKKENTQTQRRSGIWSYLPGF
ncbi:hypothetical protein QBC41DRAFT_298956 [Cercophora samala]|uniref:Uncharacterized protein n=1 Tax=Cercophora samala TaxID=330535 RepID=A0AA39ZLX4_9PEZI|nr:hypothetical protein QBC41DRAFT_298956 [Cercophora samala]